MANSVRSARTFRASRASERQAPDASRQRTGHHRLDPSRCLRRSRRKSRAHPGQGRTGGERRGANYLHAGTVRLPIFLPERGSQKLRHGRADPRPDDGGVYRKMHIPDDPLYYEKFYFTPGDLGFRAWQTRFGKIGVLICWDQWYPEAARLTAMQGAEILFTPPPSAGIPRKRPGTANVSIIHGRRFSAVMRSQTAATLPRSIVSATKPRPAGTAFSFGGKVLSPTRREKSSPMPAKKKRSCSARSTWPKWM